MADAVELGRVLEKAAALYAFELKKSRSLVTATARHYLGERRLFAPAMRAFRIGFAPSGSWLQTKFSKSETDLLVEAGLLVHGRDGLVDPMGGRVVFPQMTPQGAVVGFVGRAIASGVPEAYKYVATPQTAVFRRSEIVYRIDLSWQAMASENQAVVVEGPIDAVLLYQIGQVNAVAVGSKRMTDAQAQTIARYAKRIEVMFDRGEDEAFDQVRRLRGHYFQEVSRRHVPQPYKDPAEWIASQIDRRLTG